MKRYLPFLVVAALAFGIGLQEALAQPYPGQGTVQGIVIDATGKPLEFVEVALGGMARTKTNEKGEYAFPGSLPGRYWIRAVLVGYPEATASVVLEAGTTQRVDLVLR